MTEAIEVKDGSASDAAEIVITMARPSGWMAWYSYGSPDYMGGKLWTQATLFFDAAQKRDPYRCPYPLFETRQDAIDACAKSLPNGGQIRVVRITL